MKNIDIDEWLLDNEIDSMNAINNNKGEAIFIHDLLEKHLKEQLHIARVSKRSELLAFLDWHYEDDIADQKTKETIVDTYLSKG